MSNPSHSTRARTWGFRFSLTDGLVICICVGAVAVLWLIQDIFWWILTISVAHFFLFCNVFRIASPLELIWAVLFVLDVCLWAWFDHLTCQNVLLCQVPFTVLLVAVDVLSPTYHGILANRLNPRLRKYLEGALIH